MKHHIYKMTGCLLGACLLALGACTGTKVEDSALVADNILRLPSRGCGYVDEKGFQRSNKAQGADLQRMLRLPKFDKMWYASADGTYSKLFPYAANRLNPWIMGPDFAKEFDKSPAQDAVYVSAGRNGQYALFQLSDGGYLALLPITGSKSMAWLYAGEDGRLYVRASNFGTEKLSGDFPLLAWAADACPYAAVRRVWEIAFEHPDVKGGASLVSQKEYPEPFKYLGWCSWEQYKKDISLDLLCKTVDKIENSGVPVRWMLVDDGFQVQEGLRLKSFSPDEKRFPGGWQKLIDKRDDEKIKWFGLWHCYYGLWSGIDRDNDFGALNSALFNIEDRILMPGKSEADAGRFYDAFMGSVKDYGFDFVKIDVQTGYINKTGGKVPNAVQSNVWCSQALENSAERNFDGMINCMAHNGASFFNAKHSSVIRCSVDYFKGKPNTAKSHLYQSYQNTVWLGHVYWPDHDMFHSSDKASSKDMAISKALSGAPVYLSDDPDEFVKDLVMSLCYSDGEILRPLAPAVPLPESMFAMPLSNKQQAYRVIAPLANDSAAIMLHNLYQSPDKNPAFKNGMSLTTPDQHVDADPKVPVKAKISAQDYKYAGVMMQPKAQSWELPKSGLIWYDWYAGKGGRLSEDLEFTLEKPLDGKLILLCPVKNGWALVGLTKKFLSPASIEVFAATDAACTIRLREGGEFVIYSSGSMPEAEGMAFKDLGGGFWKGIAPNSTFRLTRKPLY